MENKYLEYIQIKLKDNYDVIYRYLDLDFGSVDIVYIKTICDETRICENIIKPITETKKMISSMELLKSSIITGCSIGNVSDLNSAIQHLISGDALILFSDKAIYCSVKKYATRAVDIPPSEAVLKGPREGFTDSLFSNVSLIRKRLKDADFKCIKMQIGEKSSTDLVILYIENVAPQKLVDHIKTQISKIKHAYVLQGFHVSEQLDTKKTAFDTIGYTEKPDSLVAKMTEGRVGILVEGDPFAIIAPFFFTEHFSTPNDYAINYYAASYLRIVRWIAFGISVLIPPLYIAITTHHFSLIPRMLAFRLAITRAGVPFPIVVEFILLMFFFQLLREAGVRLPNPIGQSISIVGALILGDAAVQSGLASTITVLLVALSAISTFLIPTMSFAIVLWSNFLIIGATMFGLPGFFIGFAIFVSHLAGITTCGYPYLFPIGTLRKIRSRDHFIRARLEDISNKSLTKDEE